MSGVGWALAAGGLFGLFQAVLRKANQSFDAFRVTFVVLVTGTVSLGVLGLVSQDLSVLANAPAPAFLWAAAAGVTHFFFGWTLLALSQQRIGASRTGVVIAGTPLLGSLLAAVILGETVPSITIVGVVLVTAGVAALSAQGEGGVAGRRGVPWLAIATATCWGVSPLFIRMALQGIPLPLLAVTVGLSSATLAFLVMMAIARLNGNVAAPMPVRVRGWTVLAGLIVAAAIAAQWTAYELTPIAIAISLMQISTPVVVLIAPLVIGTEMERITPTLLIGLILVMTGSTLVVLSS